MFGDLMDEFSKKKAKALAEKTEGKEKKQKIELIFGKKAQAMGIAFQKVYSKRSVEKIKDSIMSFDGEALGLEVVEALSRHEAMPEVDEMSMVHEVANQDMARFHAKAGKAEKFVLIASSITHYRERLDCMLFKLCHSELVDSIMKYSTTLSKACGEVHNTRKFAQLLGIVLEVGNALNKGGRKGGAQAFRVKSLMRLTQTKTNHNITLLEYIIVHIRQKRQELLSLSK